MDDQVIYERSTVEDGFGQVFQVLLTKTGLVRFVWSKFDEFGDDTSHVEFLDQDAWAGAWAIIEHLGD